jgi:predicted TIM-barrel fold metal-dependent hydrolase
MARQPPLDLGGFKSAVHVGTEERRGLLGISFMPGRRRCLVRSVRCRVTALIDRVGFRRQGIPRGGPVSSCLFNIGRGRAFWTDVVRDSFADGAPQAAGMVSAMAAPFYDCHTHLFPIGRMAGLMRWIHRAIPDFGVPIDISADQAVLDLRASGAVRWANLLFPIAGGEATALHSFGAALADRVPEITPFGGVHVADPDPLEVVEEAIDGFGMAGLKFHPMVQRFDPWDDRLAPVLAYLERRGRPIFIHTGYDEWYGHHLDRAGLEGMLATYRGLPVILPHLGFPDLTWAFRLADRFPQVWLDLTNVPGSFAWTGHDSDDDLLQTLFDGVERHSGRVLMGTDYPVGMGNLEEILRQYRSVGLTDSQLENIMVTTTRAFFDRYGRDRP